MITFPRLAVMLLAMLWLVSTSAAQPASTDGPDVLLDVTSDDSGGCYVAGHAAGSEMEMVDAVVARLDAAGTPLWTRFYDGGYWDQFDAVALHPDGGCVAAGATGTTRLGKYNILLGRYDADGNELWTGELDTDPEWDAATGVVVLDDGSIWVSGFSLDSPNGESQQLLAHFSADGSLIQSLETGLDDHDFGFDLAVAANGDIALAGFSVQNDDHDRDVHLVRVSPDGQVVWEQELTNDFPNDGHAILPLSDGGFVIAGMTHLYSGEANDQSDALLLRVNSAGLPVWWRAFGGVGFEEVWDVGQLDDGGFYLVGGSQEEGSDPGQALLIKTDSDGTLEWEGRYGGPGNDAFRGLARISDDQWVGVGFTSQPGEHSDFYFLDLSSNAAEPNPRPLEHTFALRTHPNPFNSMVNIEAELAAPGRLTVNIYNTLGQRVARLADAHVGAGPHRFVLDSRELTSGVYIVAARVDGGWEQHRRIVLVK